MNSSNVVECFDRYLLFMEWIVRHCVDESSLLIALCELLEHIVFKYIQFASYPC